MGLAWMLAASAGLNLWRGLFVRGAWAMCEERAEEAKSPGPGPPMQTLADLSFSFSSRPTSTHTRLDRAPIEQRAGTQPSQKHYVPRTEVELRPFRFLTFRLDLHAF